MYVNTNTQPPAELPKAHAFPRALACLNALTHGATSEKLFIPGENPDHLDTLMDEAFATHQPPTTADAAFVTDAVYARWMMWRRQRAHLTFEHKLAEQHEDVTHWSREDFHTLELLDRYQTHAERTLRRTLMNLSTIRKDELQQDRWREHLARAKEATALARDKFELTKAKDARLAPKQEAEALRDAELALSGLRNLKDIRAREVLKQKYEDLAKDISQTIKFNEKLNCHVICQRSRIGSDAEGRTYISYLEPSHDEIRNLIQNSDQFETPPQFVLRSFAVDGFIPAEYNFLLDEGHRRPITGELKCEHAFDFEKFFDLVEMENQILANQSEEEDGDEEDEE